MRFTSTLRVAAFSVCVAFSVHPALGLLADEPADDPGDTQCGIIVPLEGGMTHEPDQSPDLLPDRWLVPSIALNAGSSSQPTIQIHLVCDSELFQRLGANTVIYAEEMFSITRGIWNRPIAEGGAKIDLCLDGVTVIESGSDPWASSTDSSTLLNNFTAWSQASFPVEPSTRDAVYLLTGNAMDFGMGLSFVSSVCTPFSIGFVQTGRVAQEVEALVFAHMLGHTMGAMHDGAGNPCDPFGFVMSASAPSTDFSSCSIAYFQQELAEPGVADWLSQTCPEPCLADLNGDGVLDNGDIRTFIKLFLTGDLAADFNADRILDNGDIGAFINAFLAGC